MKKENKIELKMTKDNVDKSKLKMTKDKVVKKMILQVKENKNGQKRVTIPSSNEDIEHDDYVEVKKHE